MDFLQYLGRRTKSVGMKDGFHSDDRERVAYNERLNRMRKSEYQILKGILHTGMLFP